MAGTSNTRRRSRGDIRSSVKPDVAAVLQYDRYIASAEATMDQLAELFVDTGERLKHSVKKSQRGTVFGHHYYDERGKKVASVFLKQGVPTIEVKAGPTQIVVERLRAKHPHIVWATDVCLNSHGGAAEYDQLKKMLEGVKQTDGRLQGIEIKDTDHPERGARYYLGMQASPGSICLYQKGRQPGFRNKGVDNWNRVEWRLRIDPENRALASTLEPIEILALNATTRKAANAILGVSLKRIGPPPKLAPKPLQTLQYLCDTYPPKLREAGRLLGGTNEVLARLGFAIDGHRWICQRQADYVLNRTGGIDLTQVGPWLNNKRVRSEQNQRNDEQLPAMTILTGFEDEGVGKVYPLVSMPEVPNSVRIRGAFPRFSVATADS